MYNRYIPSGTSYTRILEEDAAPFRPSEREPGPPPREPQGEPLQPEPESAEKKKGGLAGLLKGLKLEELDTGDILLLLILLFLFLEGDDLELIITLGLLLLLGLE